MRRTLCPYYLAGFCPDGRECKFGVHLKSGGVAVKEEDGGERKKERVVEGEKREEEGKREFGWKGGRGGRGGRWKNKRERRGQS